ncbi:hypothetical protein J7M02_01560, partial [Candidatus Aerophobetes bacterium]|nr:hypothetical protein [Candidatus Aerophobetes bacterium]
MRITVIIALLAWLIKIIKPANQLTNKPANQLTNNQELRTIDLAILVFLAVAGASTLFISPYKHQSLTWFTNLATYTAVYFIIVNNIKSDVFPKYRPSYRVQFLNYGHSDYLQIASDMGTIGLGVYLVLVSMIFKKVIHTLKQIKGERSNQGITIGIAVALFAAIVRSFIDCNLFILQSLS